MVPTGHVPSGGKAETGKLSPKPANIVAVTILTKSGALLGTTGGRDELLSSTQLNGICSRDAMAKSSAFQLFSTISCPLLL